MDGRANNAVGVKQFPTAESFKDKFVEYIEYCKKNNLFANIAGFSVFADICRDTFYETKKYYPDIGNKIENILEDYTLNADIYHTLKIFYLKAKFGYKDGREADNSSSRINIIDDLPEDKNE